MAQALAPFLDPMGKPKAQILYMICQKYGNSVKNMKF